jgi:SAM-dependent methyltransferase
MNTSTSDYVTDVPYVRSFVPDLSPLTLRLVAALNGFPQPPAEAFHYCELGSGHGDTTATLAAAYPRARFLGVDLSPIHTVSANALATGGELTNVSFLERDFEGMGAEPGELFDFIAAHGVASWIAPAKRLAMLALASAKLKHGGLFYVGYNALPGWAGVEPLRQLMIERGDAVGGTPLERARAGVAFAKLLRDAGAEYFKGNPAAHEMIATMERTGYAYVVHEYLHAHWHPMYFAKLAVEMAAHDLYFVGQLPLHLNYRDVAVPASMKSVFKDVGDRMTFETLKDYATNQFFRRDVFIKGKVLRDAAAAGAFLDETPFRLTPAPARIPREARLPYHTLTFGGPAFDGIFDALAGGAKTIPDLAAIPALAPLGRAVVADAVMRLLLGGQVAPTVARTANDPALDPFAPGLRVPLAYNRMILRDGLSPDHPIVLASPVAGTGFGFSMIEGVALRLLTEVPEPEWRAWVTDFAASRPFVLKVADQAIQNQGERAQVLLASVRTFAKESVGRLLELGILARDG